ncbi:hypothetical protein F5Y14DRAFT_453789 [Nemania sp. NC0429]|nr:hypothetical protein F5Y14DRAFT_453789 [Nemania sp. NC0429]
MAAEQQQQQRPAGKSWVNNLMMSVMRLAGYDLNCCAAAPSSSASASTAAAAAAAAAAQEVGDPTKIGTAAPSGAESAHPLPADLEGTRALLEGYSGIPAGDVARHVYQMRDRLWDVYPDPCVGRFRFASLDFAADAYYQVALFKLLQAQSEEKGKRNSGKGGDDGDETRLLDVGCCVGQVLRKLAFDGVESSRLFGTDIEPRFLDIGYDLFRDRGTFRGGFVFGDLLGGNKSNDGSNDDDNNDNYNNDDNDNDDNDSLAALDGKMTFVHATSFFHLFTWDEQVHAASRIVRFLDRGRPDVMIFGRQVGTVAPRARSGRAGSDKVYLHDAGSWQALWDEVGARTGTRWRAAMEPTEKIQTGAGGVESALRKMSFCVVRG